MRKGEIDLEVHSISSDASIEDVTLPESAWRMVFIRFHRDPAQLVLLLQKLPAEELAAVIEYIETEMGEDKPFSFPQDHSVNQQIGKVYDVLVEVLIEEKL